MLITEPGVTFRGEHDWKDLDGLVRSPYPNPGSPGPMSALVYSLRVPKLVAGSPRRGKQEVPVEASLRDGGGVQRAPLLPDGVEGPEALDPLRQAGRLAVLAGLGDEVQGAPQGEARDGEDDTGLQKFNC